MTRYGHSKFRCMVHRWGGIRREGNVEVRRCQRCPLVQERDVKPGVYSGDRRAREWRNRT